MVSDNSMGAYLRDARRRRRVSIDRAAEQTRIRPDYLMRMESDEFDFLAPAYVRGFLRTYSRFLRVNEEPLIEEFDRKFGRGRTDTATIAALETRARSLPRRRQALNSWTLAALLAAFTLVTLALVGIFSTPDEGTPTNETNIAGNEDESSPAPEESPDEEPEESPSPEATPTEEATLALNEGLEVRVVARRARCWIEVTSDGELLTPGGITLEVGDRSETFVAEDDMQIVLGFAEGVDLIVNGRNLGAPGGPDAIVVNLPEDVRDLF